MKIGKIYNELLLTEEQFRFSELSYDKQRQIYNVFKKSYEESVGTSWDEAKFMSRAKDWLFFGDMDGFISVRVQRSGFYKLVGMAGNIRSIVNGFNELEKLNKPVWGMVSSDIQSMAIKKGFKTPPAFLLKVLFKVIPSYVFGGVDFDINDDGSLTLKYSDVGDAKKYFIGNNEYFKQLKSNILPTMGDKLKDVPLVVRKGIDMFLSEGKAINLFESRKNPEINVDKPIYGEVMDFINKYKANKGLIFISFRDTVNVSFINPNNYFETPTGIYTYPWEDFYEDKFYYVVNNKSVPRVIDTVPFAGERQYMYLYKLKSYEGILTNNTKYSEILPYAKKLLSIFPNEGIINLYINDYDKFIADVYNKNNYSNSNLPEVHKFWILLYELAINKGGKKQNVFSSICRSIGVNGFVDYGDGYIHPAEDYQAVFFRGKGLIDDIKIIDLYKFKQRIFSPININNKKILDNLDSSGIDYLIYSAKDKQYVIDRLLSSDKLIDKMDFNNIASLLKNSEDTEYVIDRLLSSDKLIDNLNTTGIYYLLFGIKDKEPIIKRLLSSDNLINNLDLRGIDMLYSNFKDKEYVLNRLLSSDKLIYKLNQKIITDFFYDSKDKQKLKNLLLDKGVSKDIINNAFKQQNDYIEFTDV